MSVPSTFFLPSSRTRRCPTAAPASGEQATAISERAPRIALTIFRYPVQRQSTPPIASMTSASLGARLLSRSAVAATSIPGVQAPHCAAPCARKDGENGRRVVDAAPIPPPLQLRIRRPALLPLGTSIRVPD